MKLKYYLRGAGIGIIVTTIILMIAFAGHKTELTDEEIISRAEKLGMVMKEDPLFPNSEVSNSEVLNSEDQNSEDPNVTESDTVTESENENGLHKEPAGGSEQGSEKESEKELEKESEKASETENGADDTGELYHLVITSGMVPRLICAELEENGVIENASSLRQYLVDMNYVTSIIAGEYDIPYGVSDDEIYQILKAGPVRR